MAQESNNLNYSTSTSTRTERNVVSDDTRDPLSAYYLSSEDGPTSVLVTPRSDTNNFHSWSRSMRISLGSKSKLGFIDGFLIKPTETGPLWPIWNKCNLMGISWLLNSVSKDIAANVLYLSTASEMWKVLENIYSQSNGPRIFEL